ncbi:MAG: hypothetical protein ACOCWG_02820 [bacterium]
MTIPECIGVAGFLLALTTFIITRLEKRKTLSVSLYDGDIEQIGNDNLSKTYKDTLYVIMDVVNICEKVVVIDKDSIRLKLNKIEIDRHVDWLNIDETEAFLNPGTQIKYAVPLDELFSYAGIKPNTEKFFIIKGYLKDVSGKIYKTNHKYHIDNLSKRIRRN